MKSAPLNLMTRDRLGAARLAAIIKELARNCGLEIASVASAEPLAGLDGILKRHIASGHVEGLDWFTEERAEFSADPANLMPNVRSLLSVGVPYWSMDDGKPDDGVPRGRISRYARGLDYHHFLKQRMKELHARIEREVGRPVEARLLTDTARIVDRAVAARSGLGWYGKHTCVIVPGHGSWVMLGELLLDIDLEPDPPLNRDCGRCSICLDRCPTNAIVAPYTVHAPRCLSFQTIEQRGAIPREIRPLLGDWVFGCDVCQEVCPYTRAAKPANDRAFQPRSLDNAYPSLLWLLRMSEQEFRAVYRGTPVLRAKRRGMARNAAVALGNTNSEANLSALTTALSTHDEPLVRGHAAWAVGNIGGRCARLALERQRSIEPDLSVVEEIEAALEKRENPSG
ncbi:MAG: tRNA epoxyqueuosine(34) reductase QueG [Rhizobiales bacterium]|nr:tRNA epoxyqueuosine(34) reductase QueG [Hyphomicrobiales bacterium]